MSGIQQAVEKVERLWIFWRFVNIFKLVFTAIVPGDTPEIHYSKKSSKIHRKIYMVYSLF